MERTKQPKPNHSQFVDLTGNKYAKLTVLEYHHQYGPHHFWECKCDCGNECVINGNKMRSGHTRSCGCLHSGGRAIEHHGMHNSREYSTWEHLLQRCKQGHFKSHIYYDKGIDVCDRWRKSFKAFYEDMGDRPEGMTLDRIDGNKGYYKENCRWATPTQQARNMSTNRIVEIDGESMCLKEACELVGKPYSTVMSRLKLGWSSKRALTEPIRQRKRKA